MRFVALAEDTTSSPEYKCEHGLSIFIEAGEHNVLFDAGKTDLFRINSNTLGLNLNDVDIAILSHGHYDHSGGLITFKRVNPNAKLYVQTDASMQHYAQRLDGNIENIGSEKGVFRGDNVIPLEGLHTIDDTLTIFSDVSGEKLLSNSNSVLMTKYPDGLAKDDFSHEQSLIVSEGDKHVLVTACSHKGIVNIMDRGMEIIGKPFDHVIGGFHLSNPRTGICEPDEVINGISEYLMSFETQYHTCHCTGMAAFLKMKKIMGKQVDYFSTGTIIEI